MIEELRRELAAAGVRGRWQRRALEEARDHLAESDGEFGEPRQIAGEIAAVVATTQTRRAAAAAFGVLAVTGLAYLVAAVAVNRSASPDIASGRIPGLGIATALAIVILPQLAFVAGMLMVWRSLRLPTPATAGDLQVVRRRAAVALGSAAGAVCAWLVWAWQFSGSVNHVWVVAAGGFVLLAAIAVAGSLVAAATRPQAVAGPGGDLFDDLGPLLALTPLRGDALRGHQTLFAVAVAAAVGFSLTAFAWHAEGTLTEGLVRGLPETVAILVLYAAFGRVLALRR